MSNIYIQEPPALGKVLLKTTVGDIDLELWTKEAPKACRNFIQLCMEGYYNDTIFHRVVPNFIVQGGDPNGDGTGGESVYGSTFKDEFHSRLRFNRRGLVAMANAGKDDNGSQFFFTLNATPELQNKHTIFAKVTGETVFNMIKLTEGETDGDDRPFYPNKITSTEVLVNPFEDIVPRQTTGSVVDEEYLEKKIKKENDKGVKNFGLLSFGMEAEEDEDKSEVFRGKPKSTHDLLDDPKLSKLTVKEELATVSKQPSKETEEAAKAAVRSIKRKLQATVNSIRGKLERSMKEREVSNSVKVEKSEEVEEEYYLGKDRIEARKKQAEEIRGQIKNLKREMSDKKNKDRTVEDERGDAKKFKEEKSEDKNELVKQYEEEQDKYRKMKDKLPKKKESRKKQESKKQNAKVPWVKNLYENNGLYADNYTDGRFLEQMKRNVNLQTVTFQDSFFGSCRLTHKLSVCVLFSVLFMYLYNDWISTKAVFGFSSILTTLGYLMFLLLRFEHSQIEKDNEKKDENEEKEKTYDNNLYDERAGGENISFLKDEESLVNKMFENNMESYLRRQSKKTKDSKSSKSGTKSFKMKKKSEEALNDTVSYQVLNDLKTVLIFLVFGYIVSPILHTLTDTVSTDTIFATTALMMFVHLLFSDYGISVSIVSNSLSINAAIFASVCLASRLSTSIHAFVLITVAVQCFVLFPILIKTVLNSHLSAVIFVMTILCAFISLWYVSMTIFYIFLVSVIFLNIYCPFLFVRWQKYKDNIYGPWDEAVVHDSDDIEECIGIKKKVA